MLNEVEMPELPWQTVGEGAERISALGVLERVGSVRPQTQTVMLRGQVPGRPAERPGESGAGSTRRVSRLCSVGHGGRWRIPLLSWAVGTRQHLKQQRKAPSVALPCKEPRGCSDCSGWPSQRAPNLQGCAMVNRTPHPWGADEQSNQQEHLSTCIIRANRTDHRARGQSPQ